MEGSIVPVLKTIEEITSLGKTPLLVVTRIDDMENIDKRKGYMSRIIEVMPMGQGNIFFHQNYHKQTYRDINVDLSTRKILSAVMRQSMLSIQKIPKKKFQSIKWKSETILVDTDGPLDEDSDDEEEPVVIHSHKPTTQSPPQSPSNKVICPNAKCEFPCNANLSTCPNCDTVLPRKKLTCSKCNEEVKESWKNCPNCSNNLKRKTECCGQSVKPTWKTCPECLKSLDS